MFILVHSGCQGWFQRLGTQMPGQEFILLPGCCQQVEAFAQGGCKIQPLQVDTDMFSGKAQRHLARIVGTDGLDMTGDAINDCLRPRCGRRLTGFKPVINLVKEPRLALGTAPDHDPRRTGVGQYANCLFGVFDIAIGKYRNVYAPDHFSNGVVFGRAIEPAGSRAPVNR